VGVGCASTSLTLIADLTWPAEEPDRAAAQ